VRNRGAGGQETAVQAADPKPRELILPRRFPRSERRESRWGIGGERRGILGNGAVHADRTVPRVWRGDACCFASLARRGSSCVALTCFVDGTAFPDVAADALALVTGAFGQPPVLWLRPARGLAGGMPVEVELLLELARR
jgi:hypothetical protein